MTREERGYKRRGRNLVGKRISGFSAFTTSSDIGGSVPSCCFPPLFFQNWDVKPAQSLSRLRGRVPFDPAGRDRGRGLPGLRSTPLCPGPPRVPIRWHHKAPLHRGLNNTCAPGLTSLPLQAGVNSRKWVSFQGLPCIMRGCGLLPARREALWKKAKAVGEKTGGG